MENLKADVEGLGILPKEDDSSSAAEEPAEKKGKNGKRMHLFTAKNSPNCMIVKQMLSGKTYTTTDAYANQEKTRQYQVTQVPTLILESEEGKERYVGVNEIRQFLEGTTWEQS